jgi:hypothetical protein
MEKLPPERSDQNADEKRKETPLERFRALSVRLIKVPISEFRIEQDKYKNEKKP